VVAGALVGGLAWVWVRMPRSAVYGAEGPTPLGRATTRVMVWWSGAGMPPARQSVLELRGRKSGLTRSLPVVIATVDGERYLVSMLGARASWVANARAGGPAALRHGRREAVRLVEVFGPGRVPVLREYLRLATGARPFFPLRPDAPEADFAALVDRYPVFRVVPA
jgi:hypothetical protein